MKLTMLLHTFYLFIEMLTVKENVYEMSFNVILKQKKKQIYGSSTEIKESFKHFET